jgi:hypothetical protein
MPAITKCKLCGFKGNHGFDYVNGGIMFYHGDCQYWVGDDGKTYKSHLDLFKSVTAPRALRDGRDPGVKNWIKARIADLSGQKIIAKRNYDLWKQANKNL